MANRDAFWRTRISDVKPNEVRVRGYDLMELIGTRSFGDVTFLLLSGDLPTGNEGRLLEAMLVACTEHSLIAPSVDAARFVASSGVPLQAGVAAGMLALGDVHGGAVEEGADMLLEADDLHRDPADAAALMVARYAEERRRVPGYGHVVHDPDPRGRRLFEVAGQLGFRRRFCELALAFEPALQRSTGRDLKMNIDGSLAALLLELGLDPALGKALYVIGRAPGLVTHVHEEQTRERPYRDIGWKNVHYEGPDPRPLPDHPTT